MTDRVNDALASQHTIVIKLGDYHRNPHVYTITVPRYEYNKLKPNDTWNLATRVTNNTLDIRDDAGTPNYVTSMVHRVRDLDTESVVGYRVTVWVKPHAHPMKSTTPPYRETHALKPRI